MLTIVWQSQFKKDFKNAKKGGKKKVIGLRQPKHPFSRMACLLSNGFKWH